MILFHSDLDNTLIYSYKHDIGPDKTCVEIYQDREISFMTTESLQLLKRIQTQLLFIPTTTRTIQQYQRIHLDIGTPKYALVCNGGILLKDGLKDADWYQESLKLVSSAQSDIDKSLVILEKDKNRYFEIRYIEDLFIFTKTKEPKKTIRTLCQALDTNKVDVFHNGEKVYVLPKELNKGNSILRLKKKLSSSITITAGDSEFDLSMLKVSDIGFCPEGLLTEKNLSILEYPKETFTVKMLTEIERLIHTDELNK